MTTKTPRQVAEHLRRLADDLDPRRSSPPGTRIDAPSCIVGTPFGDLIVLVTEHGVQLSTPDGHVLGLVPAAAIAGDPDDPAVQGAAHDAEVPGDGPALVDLPPQGPDEVDPADVQGFNLDDLARDLFTTLHRIDPHRAAGVEGASFDPARLFHGQDVGSRFRIAWFGVAVAAVAIAQGRDLDVPTPIGRLFVGGSTPGNTPPIEWEPGPLDNGGALPPIDFRADGQIVGPWFEQDVGDDAPPAPAGRPALSVVRREPPPKG